MHRLYEVSPEAETDLFEIWCSITEDSVAAANRVEVKIRNAFENLAGFRLRATGETIFRRGCAFGQYGITSSPTGLIRFPSSSLACCMDGATRTLSPRF
jgi:plasmid stabilization system protein ParE